MTKLHHMPVPEIVVCNIACNIILQTEVEFYVTSAIILHTIISEVDKS